MNELVLSCFRQHSLRRIFFSSFSFSIFVLFYYVVLLFVVFNATFLYNCSSSVSDEKARTSRHGCYTEKRIKREGYKWRREGGMDGRNNMTVSAKPISTRPPPVRSMTSVGVHFVCLLKVIFHADVLMYFNELLPCFTLRLLLLSSK